MSKAALIPAYCQQCLAIVRRTALTSATTSIRTTSWTALRIRPRTIFSTQQTPSVAFSSSQQIREAFLRAGPGRELGSAAARRHQSQQTSQTPAELHNELDPLSSDTQIDTPLSEPTTKSSSRKSATLPAQTTRYKEIILLETDFRERFIKGGGNGGQKINKTNSNVELKHFETGIVVQCQATRSLPQNRKLARRILVERLDEYYNGDLSKRGQKAEKIREKKKRMARKSAKKYHGSGGGVDAKDDDGDDGDDDDSEQVAVVDSMVVPESNIQLTTLEEILAGDNKKPSRRKSSRAH
ncbi:MAG: RF-1 domain-containing protein [Linnemannia elongata]|nr:MAG: RF-1 domain-containing protein [Linnemannia elongata]